MTAIAAAELCSLRELAEHWARLAGSALLRMQSDAIEYEPKSSLTDRVSSADLAAQRLILDGIVHHRPDDGILAEEGVAAPSNSGLTWIVDPLDGTTNYLRGYPGWAVSICLRNGDDSVVGVVFDPSADLIYSATRGGGAHRNGDSIQVSSIASLSDAIIGTGFSYHPDLRRHQARRLVSLLPQVADIRRGGSAALDLCRVAEGSLDGFAEDDLGEWDWAAGELVVIEAGGTACRWSAHPSASGVAASAPSIFGPLQQLLTRPLS